ncbi:MAG: D-alanyl-D-alanine carboxypeptidase [Oscillospiraceae bacterium]|nr:D-alanyl-D-alanine carboxypeptidase [Oscillospiraceae bacterium]
MRFCKVIAVFLCAIFVFCGTIDANAQIGTSAKASVLIEAASGQVICAKNEHQKLPMASTTKIMTALLTLEQGKDRLDEQFVVDSDAIMVEGTSMGLQKGDTVSLRALCVGMLLASGNDASNAAAVRIGGNIENFVKLMNERAKQIGIQNTSFETPSGLDGENHYSSAYDMALLAREAIKNDDFLAICSASTLKTEFGNPISTRYFTNHNKLLKSYDGAIGVKTGFTKKAGRCLVSAATRNGVTLIAVTLGAPNDWQDHKNLLDYGFSKCEKVAFDTDFLDVNIGVVGAEQKTIPFEVSTAPQAVVLSGQKENITRKIYASAINYAPIYKGQKIGSVCYFNGENLICEVDLIASQDIFKTEYRPTLWDRIKSIFT